MAIDPVCKMEVSEEEKDTIRTKHAGKTFYFCSDSCKARFLKEPSKYI